MGSEKHHNFYEEVCKNRDFVLERTQGDKRTKMAKYMKAFACCKSLDPEDVDYALTHFFFSLLKSQSEETGFWGKRNAIARNLKNVQVFVVDLIHARDEYEHCEVFLDSILAPEEYEKFVLDGRYLLLGWFMLTKEEPDGEKYLYVNCLDTFLKGLNIGKEMWKSFDGEGPHDDILIPHSVTARCNSYFASFGVWVDLEEFHTSKSDLYKFLENLKFEDPAGFIEELKKRWKGDYVWFEGELPAKIARKQ